jgi:hypothetical protein
MATVITAMPPQIDGYTGATGVPGAPSPNPATGTWAQTPGNTVDTPGHTQPSPRLAIPLNPAAARWLFPPQTDVPAASPFTRYPVQP